MLIPTFAATACFYTLFSWLCSAKLGNVVQAKDLDLRRPYFGLCNSTCGVIGLAWCRRWLMGGSLTQIHMQQHWLLVGYLRQHQHQRCVEWVPHSVVSQWLCRGFNLLFVWLLTHTFAPLLDLPVHYGRCVLLYHKANSIYLTICRQTDNFIYIEIGSIIIR